MNEAEEQNNNIPENQQENNPNQENVEQKVEENPQPNVEEKVEEKVEENPQPNVEQKVEENPQPNVEENQEVKEPENIPVNAPEEILDQNNAQKNENENMQENANANQNIIQNNENIQQNQNPNVIQNNENKIIENEENKNVINEVQQPKVDGKLEELRTDTPSSSIKDKEETIAIIKSKIKEIRTNYNFYNQYHDIIFKIIKSLEDLTYEKITNSVQDSLNYLSFFKNCSELYSKFAEQIKNSNKIITSTTQKPKMNDNFLNDVMQDTQNIFYQNLSKFSTGLKQNIIAKGPLSKLIEKTNKIEVIKKTNLRKFIEIVEKRKKFYKKYKAYQNLLNSFLPEENINNNNNINNNAIVNQIPGLVDSPDFVCVIKELSEAINKLILENNLFVIETKDALHSINNLFVDINNLVKESILIYIQESKIFFGTDVNKKFEEIENYFKKLEEEQKDNIFKLDKIFSEQKDKDNIFNLLQQYFELLNNSEKVKKELISDKNTFSIEQYPNIINFFEWLISISPQPKDISIDELIDKKMEVKRDPGIFSRWKKEVMVFTKQHHVILFDKPNAYFVANLMKIFELDKISYRKTQDSKKPFLFEIIANTKGKIMNYKGSFLFDALSNENLDEISKIIPKENIENK